MFSGVKLSLELPPMVPRKPDIDLINAKTKNLEAKSRKNKALYEKPKLLITRLKTLVALT